MEENIIPGPPAENASPDHARVRATICTGKSVLVDLGAQLPPAEAFKVVIYAQGSPWSPVSRCTAVIHLLMRAVGMVCT